MKKLVLIMAFLSFNTFAGAKVNPDSYVNNNCSNIQDPKERKDCVNIEKKNEARNNFKNFEENNRSSYQKDF